jgi:hypothetical protein
MSRRKISNLSLRQYRNFLQSIGCKYVSTSGGHEKWTKEGISRPIIIQTHINPIPERIIRSNLKTLGIDRKEFEQLISSKK